MRVQQDKWSRRSFMQATAAGVATGVMGTTLPRQAAASDGLRSIGLGVSEINEIQDKATKDLGFPVAGQAMGYGECPCTSSSIALCIKPLGARQSRCELRLCPFLGPFDRGWRWLPK